MNKQVFIGRILVLIAASACCGISAFIILTHIDQHGSSVQIVLPRLIRFTLTVGLFIFIYRGARWAKWIVIVFFGAAVIKLSFALDYSGPLLLITIYANSIIFLMSRYVVKYQEFKRSQINQKISFANNLFEIVTPPAEPINHKGDWNAVEQKFNIKFPQDFKNIIENYGTGAFSDLFQLISPFSSENDGYESFVWEHLEYYDTEDFDPDDPDDIKALPKYPEPDGVFPFGVSDRGETLYWITKGHPDEWKVYLVDHRGNEAFVFNMGCELFLVRWYNNKLKNYAGNENDFKPYFGLFLDYKYINIHLDYIDEPFLKRFEAFSSFVIIKEKRSENFHEPEYSEITYLTIDDSTEITYSDNHKYGGVIHIVCLGENEKNIKKELSTAFKELNWKIRFILNNEGDNPWPEFKLVKKESYKNIRKFEFFDFASTHVWKLKRKTYPTTDVMVCNATQEDVEEGNPLVVHADFHDKNFDLHPGYIYYQNTNDQANLKPHFLFEREWLPIYVEGEMTEDKMKHLTSISNKIFPLKLVSIEALGLKPISGIIDSFHYARMG